MKNKQNRILVHIITNIVIFFVLIFGILLYSHRENYNRQITHINQYIGEMSTRTAEHVGDVFQDKADAIASIAYLYGTSLKSPKVDLEYLKEVEDNSGFDWIRFIDPDGDDYTSQGMLANVADREYFRKGINGQSGISIVERSRVSGERLLGFYAPVRYQNKICGVMVGFLQENTVSKILETVLYDYPTNTVIVDREGLLVGKYMQEDMQSLDSIDTLIKRITKDERKKVWKAIASNQKLRYSFQGDCGDSIGYVVPVKGTEWSLMQFFPSEATEIIVSGVNQDEHIVMILFGIVIFLFCMQLIYFLKCKRDIDSARENRNKLTSLLQSVSDDYICLIDVNLDTEMEEQFRMFGGEHLEDWAKGNYNYNDSIRNYANQFISAKDRKRFLESTTLKNLKSILAHQKDYYIEYDALIDGKPCRLQGKFIINRSKKEEHMLVGIRDITELTRATVELERAKEAAESAAKAKSTFLFNMSHDIRTPMNAIMGFSAMAEKYVQDPKKVLDCLNKLNVSGEHLLKLINDVLDMARIENNRMDMDIRAHHIPDNTRKVEYIFQADVAKKQQTFEVCCDVQDEVAFYDLLRINQVELNLISNAIKYTPQGGHISYEVTQVSAADAEGTAVYQCAVKDDGIGMSKEFCENVFEMFERERSSMENGIEGTGLGLAITKKLVEQMNGSITCQSEPGKGSEFVVRFPLKVGTMEDVQDDKQDVYLPSAFQGKRVLLVEDNALNREISGEVLMDDGFLVETAENGVEAVEKVQASVEGYYDLILMDIQMPKMNGYEAARKIRALSDPYQSQIPIVAVTANAFEEDKRAAKEAGMNGHVAKPLNVSELHRQMAECLGRSLH